MYVFIYLQATGSKIGNILESFAVILSSLVVAFISSWKLALVVVAFLPLMIGAGIAQGKLTMGFSKKNKGSLEQAGQVSTFCDICKLTKRS